MPSQGRVDGLTILDINIDDEFTFALVGDEDIKKIIRNLKFYSMGLDGIPTKMIKIIFQILHST